mgnify:CR=1 FL=1
MLTMEKFTPLLDGGPLDTQESFDDLLRLNPDSVLFYAKGIVPSGAYSPQSIETYQCSIRQYLNIAKAKAERLAEDSSDPAFVNHKLYSGETQQKSLRDDLGIYESDEMLRSKSAYLIEVIESADMNHQPKALTGSLKDKIDTYLKKIEAILPDKIELSMLRDCMYLGSRDEQTLSSLPTRHIELIYLLTQRIAEDLYNLGNSEHAIIPCKTSTFQDTLYVPQSRDNDCVAATFAMVHSTISGEYLNSRAVRDAALSSINYTSNHGSSSILDHRPLYNMLESDDYQRIYRKRIKNIPLYGASMSEIVQFVDSVKSRRPNTNAYMSAMIGSEGKKDGNAAYLPRPGVLHNVVVLRILNDRVIVHDPSIVTGMSYKELCIEEFMGRWAQGLMRGNLILDFGKV